MLQSFGAAACQRRAGVHLAPGDDDLREDSLSRVSPLNEDSMLLSKSLSLKMQVHLRVQM